MIVLDAIRRLANELVICEDVDGLNMDIIIPVLIKCL